MFLLKLDRKSIVKWFDDIKLSGASDKAVFDALPKFHDDSRMPEFFKVALTCSVGRWKMKVMVPHHTTTWASYHTIASVGAATQRHLLVQRSRAPEHAGTAQNRTQSGLLCGPD